jgi:hypothetical protein
MTKTAQRRSVNKRTISLDDEIKQALAAKEQRNEATRRQREDHAAAERRLRLARNAGNAAIGIASERREAAWQRREPKWNASGLRFLDALSTFISTLKKDGLTAEVTARLQRLRSTDADAARTHFAPDAELAHRTLVHALDLFEAALQGESITGLKRTVHKLLKVSAWDSVWCPWLYVVAMVAVNDHQVMHQIGLGREEIQKASTRKTVGTGLLDFLRKRHPRASCLERDVYFYEMHLTGKKPAAIRDQCQQEYPEHKLTGGKAGRQVVETSLKKTARRIKVSGYLA